MTERLTRERGTRKPQATADAILQTRSYAAIGVTCLTERDVALLCDLWGFGLLLRDQIHALHFSECELRRVNRRLKILSDSSFVIGSLLPLGPLTNPTMAAVPGSRSQRVYRLGPAGAEVVARRLEVDLIAVRQRIREGSRTHAAHALEVANARIVLEQAARRPGSGARVVSFTGEAPLRHAFEVRRVADGTRTDAAWRLQVFKPDALAICEHGGSTHHLFFEVDLSWAASAEIAQKLRIHGIYLKEGLFARRFGPGADAFRTLVLTTGERRAEHLKALAEEEGAQFAWFTTLTAFAKMAVRRTGLFAPIWHVPFSPQVQPLFPEGDR